MVVVVVFDLKNRTNESEYVDQVVVLHRLLRIWIKGEIQIRDILGSQYRRVFDVGVFLRDMINIDKKWFKLCVQKCFKVGIYNIVKVVKFNYFYFF